jgi:hypothetical protein
MGCEVFSQLTVLDYGETCELLELMGIVNSSHSGVWAFVFIASMTYRSVSMVFQGHRRPPVRRRKARMTRDLI